MGLAAEIKSVVNWDAPSIKIDDSLRKVIHQMVTHKTSALLVKEDNEVVGVVTDIDVMDSINNKDLDAIKASEFMSTCELIKEEKTQTPCAQLYESESAQNALKLMSMAGVHHLLVSGEKKEGLLSVNDLLKLAIES